MSIIIALLAFIFALCLIISIHELGHFIFSKKAGILCYDYSIGMGPLVYGKRKGETMYGIRAVPIGGFVSMAGEEISSDMIKEGQEIGLNFTDGSVKEIVLSEEYEAEVRGKVLSFDLYGENNSLFIELIVEGITVRYEVLENAKYVENIKKQMQIAPYNRSFESKTLLQRFLTIFAGPAMNFILAFVLFLIVAFATGEANLKSNEVGSIANNYTIAGKKVNSPVFEKIQKGDKIIKINGITVSSWTDISNALDKCIGMSIIDIEVMRDKAIIPVTINPIVYLGNLGVMGNTSENSSEGLKMYVYTTKAKEAGLKDNDIITHVSINGINKAVTSWQQLVDLCENLDGTKVVVTYLRDGKVGSATVETLSDKTMDVIGISKADILIGISPTYRFSFFGSFANAFKSIGNVVVEVFGTLGLLFGGSNDVGVSDLSGPVGIFSLVKNALTGGVISYISFIAFLSVNIGFINILPVPALDGGRLVFLGYEAVTRKKINRRVENTINMVMFVLLMLLFVYITFNDITRLFG